MIYIIDNGEGTPDQDRYLLEITDEEVEIFGSALWPLIKESWYGDFIIGSTAYINWHCDNKSEVLKTLSKAISLTNMFIQQSNGLKRRKSIPVLTDAAINKLIEWRHSSWGDTFPHYLGQQLHHFNWDEVRDALSKES